MTTTEEQVVGFLAAEWREGLRITTIPQALNRLGLPGDEDSRWRVARRLERAWRGRLGLRRLWRGLRELRTLDRKGVAAKIRGLARLSTLAGEARAWNPAVYILSNDEKLVARLILHAGRVPPAEDIDLRLGLGMGEAELALRTLTRLSFLVADGAWYRLAADSRRFLEGLGFNFHTVTLEGGEQFNVP